MAQLVVIRTNNAPGIILWGNLRYSIRVPGTHDFLQWHARMYLPDSKVSGNLSSEILGILGKEMAEFPNTFESGKYHHLSGIASSDV